MALIYSRPRIKLPKLYIFNNKRNSDKNNKINKVIFIIIIAFITVAIIIKAVTPVFNRLCIDKAQSVATIICNQQTTKAIQGYKYTDFMTIHTDTNKNIKMIEANMISINSVISDITERIQQEIG